MTNPWDRPPIPKRGDESEDITFAAVGRIMTAWEAVEFELSRLYTWYGGSLDSQALMAEYGKGSIFRERVAILERKAAAYFTAHPNQAREGQFSSLLEQAKGYSHRRNDIAHSMLFQIDQLTFFRNKIKTNLLHRPHYAIIPPLYAVRYATALGLPEFAYTSREMTRIFYRIRQLCQDLETYRLRG